MSDGFTRTALIIVANAVNRAGLHVAVELLPLQENYSGHRNHLYGAATVLVDMGLIERWRVGRKAFIRALAHPVVLPECERSRRIRATVQKTVAAKRERGEAIGSDPRIAALRHDGFDRGRSMRARRIVIGWARNLVMPVRLRQYRDGLGEAAA